MAESLDKSNIGRLFDGIAGRYDFLNHLLTLNIDRSWRRKAVRKIDGQCVHVLDVASGTADLAMALVRQGKAKVVTGIDLSEKMLEEGRCKVADAGMDGSIVLEQADCTALPFADATFDAVTCGFGVRNFNKLDKGLEEMLRVLKPGGQLVILEFSYPSSRFVRFFYDFYFSKILPAIGKKISGDDHAYSYLTASVKHFIWGKDFTARLEKAGFSKCSYKTLSMGICTVYKAYRQ